MQRSAAATVAASLVASFWQVIRAKGYIHGAEGSLLSGLRSGGSGELPQLRIRQGTSLVPRAQSA